MYKKASRLKLRFQTNQGNLDVEDLWDLSLKALNEIAKGLNKEIKNLEEDDFLKDIDVDKGDMELKLKFQVVIDVLNTKKEERQKAKDALEMRAKKQKLLDILDRKRDADLEQLSTEELEKKLTELNAE